MKTLNNIFLLFFFSFFSSIFSQWTSDAYINDFKVNDDNLNSYQTNSEIGVDSTGNFVVVWNDVRNNPGNQTPVQIYAQIINKNGVQLGNNFRIGQDTAGLPKITMFENGKFVITWLRNFQPFNKYEIYYQRFNSNGIPLVIPLRVVDTSYSVDNDLFTGLDISSDSSGNFVICWSKVSDVTGRPNLFFQRFDSAGNRIDSIKKVNESASRAEFPSIASNKDGSFVIVWQDNRANPAEGKYDIYVQRYNSSGTKISNNIKVNDDSNALLFRGGAEVSNNGNGYTVITWNDPRNCGTGEIYYQVYNETGTAVGVNRKANSSPCGAGTNSRRASMRKDKYFYIGWSDWFYSGREQFYGRRFDPPGNPIGNAYMITLTSPPGTMQRSDDCFLFGDRVYAVWTDNRNGGTNNYDIYCNVRGFQNPDTVIGITNISNRIDNFVLYEPYPNPFNPVSTIKYDIPKESKVTIKVYDLIGREVITLVNENKQPGYYEAKFDGTNYASGVYLYKIEAGSFTDVKKMVLMK